jgi:hypothetical protein
MLSFNFEVPILCVLGALAPVVKLPGRETDHSHPASAEVKNIWIYTAYPRYAFMADNFTFSISLYFYRLT